LERTDPLPTKPAVLQEFVGRFLDWVNGGRLEEKTGKYYRNGWRFLKSTSVAMLRVDQITGDCAEQLKFPGSAANANCALRNIATNVAQSGGVDGEQPCSENKNDERAWTTPSS
jgi:hypothetical protein